MGRGAKKATHPIENGRRTGENQAFTWFSEIPAPASVMMRPTNIAGARGCSELRSNQECIGELIPFSHRTLTGVASPNRPGRRWRGEEYEEGCHRWMGQSR